MSILAYQHYPVYAIMVLFLGAFLIAAIGRKRVVRDGLALLASAASLFFICALFRPVILNNEIIAYWMGNRVPAGGYAIGIALEVDALSGFFALLVTGALFVAMIYSISYMEHDDNLEQYYILILMLGGSVLGLVLTGDIFNMYIMVEIMTFAAVALTAFRKNAHGALEAAFKYLIVGSIGSACVLTGVVMLYAQAHTLNLAQLSAILPGNLSATSKTALALLFVGFSAKAFIVPFHPLAADAHGAAPASISLLISGVLTKSGIYAIVRLVFFVFQLNGTGALQFLMVGLGTVSMFVCVTMAFAQHDFKRLLAFHSISQIGYVMTALGLSTALGFSAGLFHAMNHTVFKGLLFLAAGAVLHETGTTDLNKLGGLSRKMPHTTVLFLIGAMSISGIPPFNGFASKWMIYQAAYLKAIESGHMGYLVVAIVALLTSALTLASFVKVTHSVFFGQLPAELENVKEVSFGMRFAMGILAVLCIVLGLFPELVAKYLTEPATVAAFSATNYIDAMMGSGYAAAVMGEHAPALATLNFANAGCWDAISWTLLLLIALSGVTIAAVIGKYDAVSVKEGPEYDGKYDVFFGGEKSVPSHVSGDDLFWGFKHNWHGYFEFMHNLHSGVVNDYALWAAVATAVILLFMMIAV